VQDTAVAESGAAFAHGVQCAPGIDPNR
jgi:hypothetical protein